MQTPASINIFRRKLQTTTHMLRQQQKNKNNKRMSFKMTSLFKTYIIYYSLFVIVLFFLLKFILFK